MLRNVVPSYPRRAGQPEARAFSRTRLTVASVLATCAVVTTMQVAPSQAAVLGSPAVAGSSTGTARPTSTASATAPAKPGFLTVSMTVVVAESAKGRTCQYALLLHKPMAGTRISGMNLAGKLDSSNVTVRETSAAYQIISPQIACGPAGTPLSVKVMAQPPAGPRTALASLSPKDGKNATVSIKLSSNAKNYLTVALSIVVGGVVTIAVGLLLPAIATALGLTMTTAAAAVVAACIGGIAGNLVDKAINGGSARNIVVSSVLACVATSGLAGVTTWLARNRPAIQSMVSQALSRASSNAGSQSQAATSSVFQSARSSFSSVDFPSQSAIVQQVEMSMGHASA
jgi:hypothetical protein